MVKADRESGVSSLPWQDLLIGIDWLLQITVNPGPPLKLWVEVWLIKLLDYIYFNISEDYLHKTSIKKVFHKVNRHS